MHTRRDDDAGRTYSPTRDRLSLVDLSYNNDNWFHQNHPAAKLCPIPNSGYAYVEFVLPARLPVLSRPLPLPFAYLTRQITRRSIDFFARPASIFRTFIFVFSYTTNSFVKCWLFLRYSRTDICSLHITILTLSTVFLYMYISKRFHLGRISFCSPYISIDFSLSPSK